MFYGEGEFRFTGQLNRTRCWVAPLIFRGDIFILSSLSLAVWGLNRCRDFSALRDRIDTEMIICTAINRRAACRDAGRYDK